MHCPNTLLQPSMWLVVWVGLLSGAAQVAISALQQT